MKKQATLAKSTTTAAGGQSIKHEDSKVSRRPSLFSSSSKTKVSATANVPIEVLLTDWWLAFIKSTKKKSILPSIALTGLPSVDKVYQFTEEVLAFREEDANLRFHDYVKNSKIFVPDFDQLLSAKRDDKSSAATANALPPLLYTFLLV